MLSDLFRDYQISVSATPVRSPDQILEAAMVGRYGRLMWPHFLKATGTGFTPSIWSPAKNYAQSIKMANGTTFTTYTTNSETQHKEEQIMAQANISLRRNYANVTWDEAALEIAGIRSTNSRESQKALFFSFAEKLDRQLDGDMVVGIENQFLGFPTVDMEQIAEGPDMNPLAMLVNPYTNGLFKFVAGTGIGQFTTKHTINPTDVRYKNFRNYIFGYDSALHEPVLPAKNIIGAIDDMTSWMPVTGAMGAPVQRPSSLPARGLQKMKLFMSPAARTFVIGLLRNRNTTWTQPNQAGIQDPVYNDMPLISVTGLQSMATYAGTGTYDAPLSYSTEGQGIGRGPYIYALDTESIGLVSTQEHWFHMIMGGFEKQFWKHAKFCESWINNFVPAPWQCAIIAPGAVAGVFPDQVYTPAQVYAAY